MFMAKRSQEGLNEPLEFAPDSTSKRKKGAHRPEYAAVFTQPGVPNQSFSKVHLLVNPFSGKKQGRKVAERVIELIQQQGIEVTSSFSAYSGHLVTMASALVVGPDELIAVVGGDGSLSEVITGRMLLGKDEKETFAIIPAGTGNSQAHDLGLDTVEAAVEAALNGQRQSLDLARVELTEGLPGSQGKAMVRYSHNLVTMGTRCDSTIKPRKCGGWVPSATM